MAWVKTRYTPDSIKHIRAYFLRCLNSHKFSSPIKLAEYIQSHATGGHNITITARQWLHFCELFDKLPADIISKYRSVLKIDNSKKDYFVPSDEEVIANYDKIRGHDSLRVIFLVLATAGIRYLECLDFLKDFDVNRFRRHNSFVSYNVSHLRHTKNCNNIYLPYFVFEKLRQETRGPDTLRTSYYKAKTTFSFKYLRKWNYNFLIYNNVPESVADFIQGRSSKSVSANHYLAKSQQAEFWYAKIVHEMNNIFSDNSRKSKNQLQIEETPMLLKKEQTCDYSEVN